MTNKNLELTINHLYPSELNMYGDNGNILSIVKRCKWRDIKIHLESTKIGDKHIVQSDIYFIGGGQDNDQITVSYDLLRRREFIQEEIEDGACLLAICGGYQLLGNSFVMGDRNEIQGLGILDMKTIAPDVNVKSRCIGNVVARLNDHVFISNSECHTVVGFENHSGQTYLGPKLQPLGYVIKGYGNNTKDKQEGCLYKSVIGTYLHGSFLPKNPHITDYLIEKALVRKYKRKILLKRLDDALEFKAHSYMIDKIIGKVIS